MANQAVKRRGSFSHAWRALHSRNFRLFFAGQSVSLLGTWMTRLASSWLVYRLTHSALLLGVLSFASQIVAFLLCPVTGVWVERLPRRKLLVWTQAASAAQSLAMAALTIAGVITFREIVALAIVQGLINAFDMPARQAFIVQMVDDPADLQNAIAINSTMVNGTRLIGPAIAGLVIAAVGEGWCFLIDGLSYFAVIASLLLMRIRPAEARSRLTGMWEQMREGWDYVRTFQPLRTVLLLFALTSLMGFPFMVLMPVFAAQVLQGNAATLGWLGAATGVGAVVSGISLTLRKSVEGLTRMLQIAVVVLGAALVLFGFSHSLWLSLVLMVFAGFGLMQCAAGANTVVQSLVTEDKRARVMSYYTMAFFGTAPVGSLLAGVIAHHIGAPYTVIVTGVCCLGGALWFTLHLPRLDGLPHADYPQTGMVPEFAGDVLPDEQEPVA